MTLFRASDRLPEDETILLIKDPEDFKLFRDRKALGIRGIAYDMVISDGLRQSLINCAKKMVIENTNTHTPQIKFLPSISEKGLQRLRKNFQEYSLPEEFFDAVKLFIKSRQLASDQHGTYEGYFRINSLHPDTYHKFRHPPAMTLAFNRAGTDFLSKEGKQIIAPAGRIIILDWDVDHKAPEIDEGSLTNDPRINLVL